MQSQTAALTIWGWLVLGVREEPRGQNVPSEAVELLFLLSLRYLFIVFFFLIGHVIPPVAQQN